MLLPQPRPDTPLNKLFTLVENRSQFEFRQSRLNVFETRLRSEAVPLHFPHVVFTAMLKGRKVMHLGEQQQRFDYLPGESVILPKHSPMLIDFPDATLEEPTQCLALELDSELINQTLALMNERWPRLKESGNWTIDYQRCHVQNTGALTLAVNRLLQIPDEEAGIRDLMADLTLKELLIRLYQTQAGTWLIHQADALKNQHRLAAVITFIRNNLHKPITPDELAGIACMSRPSFFRSFRREIGLTPLAFILQERITHASKLLTQQPRLSISEIAWASGFVSVPWFCLQFKKSTGHTPGEFRIQRGLLS